MTKLKLLDSSIQTGVYYVQKKPSFIPTGPYHSTKLLFFPSHQLHNDTLGSHIYCPASHQAVQQDIQADLNAQSIPVQHSAWKISRKIQQKNMCHPQGEGFFQTPWTRYIKSPALDCDIRTESEKVIKPKEFRISSYPVLYSYVCLDEVRNLAHTSTGKYPRCWCTPGCNNLPLHIHSHLEQEKGRKMPCL